MGTIRFLLALAVIFAHAGGIFGYSFINGIVAVQSFYMISGFYMAIVLNEKYIGHNNSYKLFISNRFLRLYPLYWIVLVLTVALSVFMFVSQNNNESTIGYFMTHFDQMSLTSFSFLILTNMFLFFQDIVMFLGLNNESGQLFLTENFHQTNPMLYKFIFIPQAWTIGVELLFYLIAPFIARKKLKFILLLLVFSVGLRILLMAFGLKNDPWNYRFFPTELAFFLLGIVAYHLYKKLEKIQLNRNHLRFIFAYIAIFTIAYNAVTFLPGRNYLYQLSFFLCLPFVFILTKKWKRDAAIGELSYPMYISHLLIIEAVAAFKLPVFGQNGLVVSIITILFSILLTKLVTEKIEKVRQKRIQIHLKS